MADTQSLDSELAKLRANGLVLPRHPVRAAQAYGEGFVTNEGLSRAASHDLHNLGVRVGRTITDANYNDAEVQRVMKENQALTRVMGEKRGLGRVSAIRQREARQERLYPTMPKTSMIGGTGTAMGGDVYTAIPRFYDPLEYWDLSGLPWNVADEGHRHKLHKWLRLYYATHYLVPILIDIFTRFPLVGLELEHKDPAVIEIYEDIFLNQLNYEEFLVGLGREFWCALPGEIIHGADGSVDIETVQAGDRVLTHTGDLQTVRGASSRRYKGGFVTIRPHYGLPMRYTDGHPFLVRHGSEVDWIPVEDIQTSDELFVPVDHQLEDRHTVNIWGRVMGGLTSRDWLAVPTDDEIDIMEIPDYVNWTDSVAKYRSYVRRSVKGLTPGSVWRRNARYAQHSPLQEDIELTDEAMWFFGLYLAEGYVTKDGVQIALHAKETEYAERVVNFAASLGLNATVRQGSSERGIIVVVYSISFGALMQNMFGTGAMNKRIPQWVMALHPTRQAPMLRGYFDGDGHYGDLRIHAACKSQKLALQIERLIRRLGVVTTINEAHSVTKRGTECTWYMVGPCMADNNIFAKAIGKAPVWKERERAFAEWDVNGYWVKVFSHVRDQYDGLVYNIEVNEDHSYVGSVATHNCVGEAYPLGSFDEDLGIWDHEELINPEDVVIDNFPLLGTQQLKIVPPDYLRRIAQTQSPAREWYMLQEHYEDLLPYLLKGEHIPMSPVMLRQIANKMNDWDDHGTPILMRGLRTLLHEEKLLASQDAIAERLYSPFILAKLGIMDMGDGLPPWIPSPDELQSVRDDIDIAMASDFRVMVHHFGLEMTSVFGREMMPRLGDDFDRIERRLMQVFGVNPSLLSAGSNSQPYASSALQAEFMNQILRTFQKMLKDHFHERAMVVAEAQGHYDYERKGKTRIPIYETVVEYDEDGNKELVRKRKLTCPDLVFSTFDLRDEQTERQFLMTLREAGVPIPDDKLMVGVSWKRDDYVQQYNEDVMRKTISQQRAKMDTYIALVVQGLPVPMDLKYEVESVLQGNTGPEGAPPEGPMGGAEGAGGLGQPPGAAKGPEGGPGGPGGGMVMPPPPPGLLGPGPGTAPPGGGAPPMAPQQGGPPGNVPQVSNERRPGLTYNTPFKSNVTGKLAANDELAELTKEWPEELRKRATLIRDSYEVSGGFVPGAFEPESVASSATIEETETDDPDTWVFRSNQRLEEDEAGEPLIVETKRKKIGLPIEPEKKYSLIDPLASITEEDDGQHNTE